MLQQSRPKSARQQREWLLFVLLVEPNLLLFSVFTFWPLIYNLYLSFVQWDMISLVKVWVGAANYRATVADPSFGQILVNTFLPKKEEFGCCTGGAGLATLAGLPSNKQQAAMK